MSSGPDPTASARAARLRYVYDTAPGITRHRHGKHFGYKDPDGKRIRDAETLARIKSLVIPPAWTSVWICPIPNGHLQATGRDARGRKQSRYHPRWRATRDEAKYGHMLEFGQALPLIRKRVEEHLALPGLPREKVLATIVRLLETTHIRIGNTEYARTNGSYGLTTMRRRHVSISGSKIVFNFKGKSGVRHTIDLQDRKLARIVAACRDTPGYELFTYLDDEGNPHSIGSSDVNAYLDQLTDPDLHFTAKDFRTWAGSVLACALLGECETCDSPNQKQLKSNIVQTIKQVAAHLGNTPSVCRKCYIHPEVLEAYLKGLLTTPKLTPATEPHALQPQEQALLNLLQRQLAVA